MAEMAQKISQDKITRKDSFSDREWGFISEHIVETLDHRKTARKDLERIWTEVDRQIAMKPDIRHKLLPNGRPDKRLAWLPELELPLQAQALEVLTADARRMLFPDAGPWFSAHTALTDEFLERADFQSIITGDRNEVPTQMDQEAADKLVGGVVQHWHRQYDFAGHMDKINAEAFKYGLGLGRARLVTRSLFTHTDTGVNRDKRRIPVLFPVSVRNTYIDDSAHHLMNEGQIMGPSIVREWRQRVEDLAIAASEGSNDPNDEDGGWMPDQLRGLKSEGGAPLTVIEMEGDFIVGSGSDKLFIPGAIGMVALGVRNGKSVSRVVRFRFRPRPFSSYIQFPYHVEDIEFPYPSSPLMKGWPVQKSATDIFSRMIEAGALNTRPPIRYDKDDMTFAQTGGPLIFPGAQWGTTGAIDTIRIGDPTALFNIYLGLLGQYADVTGINAPRLGQQTVSHTTAFAKEAELNRGTARTVDYVRSVLKGGLQRWLGMAYSMGRETLTKRNTVFIDAYNSFVDIGKEHLPEIVSFDAFGAGAPQEEAVKQSRKLQSLQLALQLEQIAIQKGEPPRLDMGSILEQTLREGGWIDTDLFIRKGQALATPVLQQPGLLSQGVQT